MTRGHHPDRFLFGGPVPFFTQIPKKIALYITQVIEKTKNFLLLLPGWYGQKPVFAVSIKAIRPRQMKVYLAILIFKKFLWRVAMFRFLPAIILIFFLNCISAMVSSGVKSGIESTASG